MNIRNRVRGVQSRLWHDVGALCVCLINKNSRTRSEAAFSRVISLHYSAVGYVSVVYSAFLPLVMISIFIIQEVKCGPNFQMFIMIFFFCSHRQTQGIKIHLMFIRNSTKRENSGNVLFTTHRQLCTPKNDAIHK